MSACLRSVVAVLALILAGCASVPKPLQGEFVASLPQDRPAEGTRVRWGGSLIGVEPRAQSTCFEILGRDLSPGMRPRAVDASAGRFLACRGGFYDPAVFVEGREVTIVGTVAGTVTRRIGEYDYALPQVAAEVVYLWPERPLYVDYHVVGPAPLWGPGWWYGGWFRPGHWVHDPRPRAKEGSVHEPAENGGEREH